MAASVTIIENGEVREIADNSPRIFTPEVLDAHDSGVAKSQFADDEDRAFSEALTDAFRLHSPTVATAFATLSALVGRAITSQDDLAVHAAWIKSIEAVNKGLARDGLQKHMAAQNGGMADIGEMIARVAPETEAA